MFVKVARLGNAVTEVCLESGATVEDALEAADLDVENEEIRVNSESATESRSLVDGDIVTLVPKVKGGQNIVKVARLGNSVEEVAVADDATIGDALEAADIMVENEDIRADGSSANADDRIGSTRIITVVPKVKGGK